MLVFIAVWLLYYGLFLQICLFCFGHLHCCVVFLVYVMNRSCLLSCSIFDLLLCYFSSLLFVYQLVLFLFCLFHIFYFMCCCIYDYCVVSS